MALDPADWSPADNPYAIALNEAEWWKRIVKLTILRLRDEQDRRIPGFGSHQMDARVLVLALRQLLTAVALQRKALNQVDGISSDVLAALDAAQQRFNAELPGLVSMRNALVHVDEWATGDGRFGPQKKLRDGQDPPRKRDIASRFWGFRYDPQAETVSQGEFTIDVAAAERAAPELALAIYLAGQAIDDKRAADLQQRTRVALARAGIDPAVPAHRVRLAVGGSRQVELSLTPPAPTEPAPTEPAPTEPVQAADPLPASVVDALARDGLTLESLDQAAGLTPAEHLGRGAVLQVRAG